MSGQTASFLTRYLDAYFNLKGVLVSDNQGIHIVSSFDNCLKAKVQNLIQASTLLISAKNQSDTNLSKIGKCEQKQINSINYYYAEYLIHIYHQKNIMVTLFFSKNSSIHQAKQISADIAKVYQSLNVKIPDIKKQV